MKSIIFTLAFSAVLFGSCTKPKEVSPGVRYAPTDVLVKTEKTFTIDKVFAFINSYDHDVELIHNSFYTSSLPPDSLQYVLDYLSKKAYLNDSSGWATSGQLHYLTQVIYIYPRLHQMKDRKNRADWLETIKFLKLTEVTNHPEVGGSIIFFHVPEKQEHSWIEQFKKLPFVEWAELNKYVDAVPL